MLKQAYSHYIYGKITWQTVKASACTLIMLARPRSRKDGREVGLSLFKVFTISSDHYRGNL